MFFVKPIILFSIINIKYVTQNINESRPRTNGNNLEDRMTKKDSDSIMIKHVMYSDVVDIFLKCM